MNGFTTFGDFLMAVAHSHGPHADPRLAAGANTTVPSDGGFAVPTTYSGRLIERAYATGQILSRCDRYPGPATKNIQLPVIDDTDRSDGSRFGGMSCSWVGEGESATATHPKVAANELTFHKLTGAIYATNDLLNDAPQLEAFVERVATLELTYKVESAILNGTGSGQPLGITKAPCKITVAKEGSQASASILGVNILKMWARCWGPSRRNAVWLVNQDIDTQLLSLAVESTYKVGSTTANNVRLYNPDGTATSDGYPTLLGRPVIPVEYCPTLGTEGDIVLADPSQYLIADRFKRKFSAHVRFFEDESCFLFTWRMDGQPTWAAPITPDNGTDTLSPFVTLASRE